jgi:phosphatidylglycerophosphate synthase
VQHDNKELSMPPRSLVNSFSLSRIPIALLFVLVFQKDLQLFYVSVILIVIALVTDLLDGFFARKLDVASIHGRLWDSLGDKAVYAGIIVAFNSHGFLAPVLSWGLLVREVALYITRVLYIENLPKVEQIRPFTNWHGYFMYLMIILGFMSMYIEIKGFSVDLYGYIQGAALLALICGIASIIHYLRLK